MAWEGAASAAWEGALSDSNLLEALVAEEKQIIFWKEYFVLKESRLMKEESDASRKLLMAGLDVATMEDDVGEYFKTKTVRDHQTQISKRFG